MPFIIVYITNPNERVANKVASHLLKKRLVACVNLFPIHSGYWWKGKLENAKEGVALAKTLEKNYKKIKEAVKSIHPYTVPCIMKFHVEANEDYERWIRGEVV